MRKKKIQILLLATAFLFLMDGVIPVKAQERKLDGWKGVLIVILWGKSLIRL